ncbi:MAG: WD40/YVTN/BNR-like repeat-containing protein, partial [Chlamydiota bacterium]
MLAQLPTPVSRPVGPEHDNPLARELWFRNGRTVPGKPGAAAQLLRRACQRKMQLRTAQLGRSGGVATDAYSGTLTTVTPSTTTTTGYGGWVPLGPSPINSNASGSLEEQDYGPVTGRATSVVVDPGDPTGNTVYLGGAYGGLWKSTNAAALNPAAVTWTPLIDQQATLAVGSVAVQPSSSSPSSVILVGTGEADFSIDSYYGLGILRSADGGNTWNLITTAAYQYGSFSFSGLAFAKIAFSTDNPNLVVAAATGAGNDEGASSGGNTPGLYTSTDGGQTWALGQQGVAPGIGASSVIYDAASHKFFAFLQFDGYYTSSDGMKWTRLSNQPGTTLQNCQLGNNGMPICYAFRGEMAAVPGREELYTWYVTIDQQGNIGDGGIYKTTDGGASWKQINDSGIANCGDGSGNGCGTDQGWFNLTLAAVPNGAGTDLYAGAVNLYKCSITASNALCGAKPFINLTHVYGCSPLGSLAHVHPDQHGISFLRLSASQVVMYFANDGGIYRARNGYALNSGTCGTAPNPFQNLNGTMGSMSQFVDFSNGSDSGTLLGGTQDNGSPATDTNYGTNWVSVNGGDGGFNAIDTSTGNWFTTNTDVSVQRCGAGINCLAQDFYPVVTNSTVGGDHGFFYTPFILDPQADNRMMVGTCRLWRGNSDGSGFAPLSYNFDTTMNQTPNQACSGNETQLIRSIAAGGPVTGNGSSVIYVGTQGGDVPVSGGGYYSVPGQLWVTNNADLGPFTWGSYIGPMNSSGYPISSIAVDPKDPTGNTAYATMMGFGLNHTLRTTDQGLEWLTDSYSLPNAPANAIIIDPDDS